MIFSKMTTEQVMAEFKAGLVMTHTGLVRAAKAWVELKRRGVDLSKYECDLTKWLPDIAAGKLHAGIVVAHGPSSNATTFLAKLVKEDQERIVAEGVVDLVTHKGAVKRRINALSVLDLQQVFGGGTIRTPAEQKKHMRPPAEPVPIRAAASGRSVPSVGVSAHVRSAPGTAKVEEIDLDVAGKLSEKQIGELKQWASRRGMTPAGFIVDLLVRNKVITDFTILNTKFNVAPARRKRA